MSHPNEDQLLKLVLELLDTDETRQIKEHLAECEPCRQRLEEIQSQTEMIGSIEPEIDREFYPLPATKRVRSVMLLKAAALILIGFLAGYGASQFSQPEPVNVVPQRIQVTSDEGSVTDFTICESVDLTGNTGWRTYQSSMDSLDT
jgi:anti-sigma factor RsiW